MLTLKSLSFTALVLAVAAPALADASMTEAKTNLYDADFETVIAAHGYVVGTAVYGAYDADYDVHLTDASMFKPLLGSYDADYEVMLNHAAFADMEIAAR